MHSIRIILYNIVDPLGYNKSEEISLSKRKKTKVSKNTRLFLMK